MDSRREPPGDAPVHIRLNKLLADCGVASRRKADELIADGRVWIDGVQVRELGTRVDPEAQRVEVDGTRLTLVGRRKRYYLLNKPSGVICTNERNETRPRAVDLITDRDKGRIYTVGRLDEETVGLVILTSDGDFAHKIMHPRFSVPKTYMVRLRGRIFDEDIQKVRDGVYLPEGRTAGARVLLKKRSENQTQLWVTLNEGKNREIRRVFARLGYTVTHLRRNRIGTIGDRGLKTGRWRPLARAEVEELIELAERGGGGSAEAGSPGRAGRARRSGFARPGPWAEAARGQLRREDDHEHGRGRGRGRAGGRGSGPGGGPGRGPGRGSGRGHSTGRGHGRGRRG